MHGEKGDQAAGRDRDIVGNEARQYLHRVANFIDWPATRVGDRRWERVNQPRVRQVATLFDDLWSRERQHDVIENHPSVHEEAADDGETAIEARVVEHDLAILAVFHVPPVVLHQVHAFTYASLADHENQILRHGHHEEAERGGHLHLVVNVRDLDGEAHDPRDQDEREQTVAEKIQ